MSSNNKTHNKGENELSRWFEKRPLAYQIIHHLIVNKESTIDHILQDLSRSRSTISHALKQLESENIIQRTQNPEDQRQYSFSISNLNRIQELSMFSLNAPPKTVMAMTVNTRSPNFVINPFLNKVTKKLGDKVTYRKPNRRQSQTSDFRTDPDFIYENKNKKILFKLVDIRWNAEQIIDRLYGSIFIESLNGNNTLTLFVILLIDENTEYLTIEKINQVSEKMDNLIGNIHYLHHIVPIGQLLDNEFAQNIADSIIHQATKQ